MKQPLSQTSTLRSAAGQTAPVADRLAVFSPAPLFITDERGAWTYVSPHWQDLFEEPTDQFLGEGWRSFLEPGGRREFEQSYERAIQAASNFTGRARFLMKGRAQLYELSSVAQHNGAGEFQGLSGRLERVPDGPTDRPEDLEDLFPSLFQQSLGGVVSINTQGEILLANARFGEMIGLPPEGLKGRSIAEITYAEDVQATINAFRTMLSTRKSFSIEKRYLRPDGSFLWALSTVTPVLSDQGEVRSIIALVQEISARKRAEAEAAAKQSYFQGLIDTSPAMIWITDAASRCVYLSKQWYEFTGRTPEQDLNFGWLENIHPEDLSATAALYKAATEAKGPLSLTYRLRRRDGSYRWSIDIGNPHHSATGEFLGYVGTVIDIHEQKLTTERLLESQQQLETLTNFTPQIIWTARPDGTTDWFNERWYEFTGFGRDEVGDEAWKPILHPEDAQKCYDVWYHSVQSGEPYNIEYRFWDCSSQSYRWFLGQALPIRNRDGIITRWFGACVDIHEQKTLSEELQKTVQARDEFLSIASHELRTPLTALKLQAQTLERALAKGWAQAYSKDRIDAFARQTSRQATRLSRLVDDMLDVSRIRTGLLPITRRDLDLGELAREVAQHLDQQLAAETDEPTTVTTEPSRGRFDPLRLEQVITNLLTNAIRYGRRRSAEIDVRPIPENGTVLLTVRDHGVGIPAESLEKIFEPYERAGMSANEVSGLGLGLYITKQIVDAHGGSIRVESVPGEGSTFRVELPAAAPEEAVQA